MRDIITDDYDLGNGWILYTEYNPVDEDAGIWGWYWAIGQADEDLEGSLESRWYSSARSDLQGCADFNSGEAVFGPFRTEEIAKESGISYCMQTEYDTAQWARLTIGE